MFPRREAAVVSNSSIKFITFPLTCMQWELVNLATANEYDIPMSRKVFPEQHYLETVQGHDAVKSYLVSALESDRLPHALLFHGPGGLGKLSTAYALVKYLNCLQNSPAGCGCNMCRKVAEGKFADVLLVEPRGATGMITLNGWRPGKDDPDNLQYYRFLETRPLEGSRKVLIFRHAERMNVALANYILKLMEEPPPYLTLILVSDRKSELLPTIRSRCAPVKFNPLSLDEMGKYVQSRDLNADTPDVAAAIRLSEGRPGLFDSKMAASAEEDQQDLAAAMACFKQYGFVAMFRVASDVVYFGEAGGSDAGSKFELSLGKLSSWFRDVLLVKLQADNDGKLLAFPVLRNQLQEFGNGLSNESLVSAYDAIGRYRTYSRRQTDKNYALECLLMEIGRIIRG
jgi:DNA polymerase-3 subunit delta'